MIMIRNIERLWRDILLRYPLLLFLLFIIVGIITGDIFCPYGLGKRVPEWAQTPATYQAVVLDVPKISAHAQRVDVRLLMNDEHVQLTLAKKDSVGGFRPSTDNLVPSLLPGDLVVFYSKITLPHNAGNPGEMDYAAYLRHHGITGTAFCPARDWKCIGAYEYLTFRERLLRFRSHLVQEYGRYFEGETLAVLSAMTLGDKTRIDSSVRELYSRSGTSHVLALSGLHLAILLWLLRWLFKPLERGRIGRWLATALLLTMVWLFVTLAGIPISLLRAAIMLTIWELMMVFRLQQYPFQSLILALIIILVATPNALFDVGLQLSALSVAGIQWMTQQPIYTQEYRLGKWYFHPLRFILVSLIAQLVTLPLVAHYFGVVSFIGVLSNWVTIPISYVLLGGAILFLLFPFLQAPIALCLKAGYQALAFVLHGLTSLPFSSVELSLSWWGVAGCYLLLLFWLVARHLRIRYRWSISIVIVFFIAVGELVVDFKNHSFTGISVYNRPSRMEIHCLLNGDEENAQKYRFSEGNILAFAGQRMAIANKSMPARWVSNFDLQSSPNSAQTPPQSEDCGSSISTPLSVDVLLISRGAKGHLSDYLLRYHPSLIALDGCLSDYYHDLFLQEAAAAHLPVYDIRSQGALLLEMKK